MRRLVQTIQWLTLAALVVVSATSASPAQETSKPKAAASKGDDEAVALAFVREHHPELAELLLQLKPMKPGEYQKAVRELSQVSRTLADLKQRDPRRYEYSLSAWKFRSKVDLLSARLASTPEPNPDLESQLRHAIEDQIDQEILRLKFEKGLAEERLKRVQENLDRAETRHDQVVENRYKAMLKAAQKAREKASASRKTQPETKPKPDSKPSKDDKGKNQP